MTGLESDADSQRSEPTPQALSDGILVVGISSKGPRDLAGVENRIRYGKAHARARARAHARAHA